MSQYKHIILCLYIVFGMAPLALALPDPVFSYDPAPMNAAREDINELRMLNKQIVGRYIDLYFESYAKIKKVNVLYTPRDMMKGRFFFNIDRTEAKDLMNTDVKKTVARYKKYADEFAQGYEESGQLAIGQRLTQYEVDLQQFNASLAAIEEQKQDLQAALSGAEKIIKNGSVEALMQESSQTQFSQLKAEAQFFKYGVFAFLALCVINFVLLIYFYKNAIY